MLSVARAHREYAERIVAVLLILCGIVVLASFIGPLPTGKATITTVNVTQVQVETCYFPLEAGIDLYSFNCISNRHSRGEVFNQTDTSQIAGMYAYVSSLGDPWQVWNPQLPSWVVHDLAELSRLKGYVIRISGNGTVVNYTGFLAPTSDITVSAGSNLVGYPSIKNDTLPVALTTVNTTFRSIKTIRGGVYETYWRNGSGNLSELYPYEGYWLNMSVPGIWTVQRNRTG